MASDLNNVTISGRLGRNPALKVSAKGRPFTSFSLANNIENQFGQHTSWLLISARGEELALSLSRRLTKGQHVTVVGQLETSFDKESGQSYFGITAQDVHLTEHGVKPQNLNHATIAGRLGRDAQFKLVGKKADQPMLTFSIANSAENEYQEKTSWVNVVVWGEYALAFSKVKLAKGQHVTVTGQLETRLLKQTAEVQEDTTTEQPRLLGQLVASKVAVAVNDRTNFKRYSGLGNGAEKFEHYSQKTTFDRYTNELQPELATVATDNAWSSTKGWQVAELNRNGEIYRYHGDPFPASTIGKLAAQKFATQLGSEWGRPQQFTLKLVTL